MRAQKVFTVVLAVLATLTTGATYDDVIGAVVVGDLETASAGLLEIAATGDALLIAEILAEATASIGGQEIAEAMAIALSSEDLLAIEGLGNAILICFDSFTAGPVYDTCIQSLSRAKALDGGCDTLTLTLSVATATAAADGKQVSQYKTALDEARVGGCVPFIAASASASSSGGMAVSRSSVVNASASAEAFVSAVASGDSAVAGEAFSSAVAEPQIGGAVLNQAAEQDSDATAQAIADALVQGDAGEIASAGAQALAEVNSSAVIPIAQAVADAAIQGYVFQASEVASGALNSASAVAFAQALAQIVDGTDACRPTAQSLAIAEGESMLMNANITAEALAVARSIATCLEIEEDIANRDTIKCPLIRCLIPKDCCEFPYKVVGGFCQDRIGNPYTYEGVCERRKTLLREGGRKVVVSPVGKFGLSCYCE